MELMQPADLRDLERISEAKWFDPAYFSTTAAEAAKLAIWLVNIPIRQAQLEFIPHCDAIDSWTATMRDLAEFLFDLIERGGNESIVRKVFERVDSACQRIDNPEIDERGPWAALIDPLWERSFAAGKHLHLQAFLTHSARRAVDRWSNADPFKREESAFTEKSAALVRDIFNRAGFVFEFVPDQFFPWDRFCTQLSAFVVPHLAISIAVMREALSSLLFLIKNAERGDVGRYREDQLYEALLNTFERAVYSQGVWRYGELQILVPELSDGVGRLLARRADEERINQGGY
ncbi:MAG: hypothetical protein V4710_03525 [Verrucomicrobiota bacterium]